MSVSASSPVKCEAEVLTSRRESLQTGRRVTVGSSGHGIYRFLFIESEAITLRAEMDLSLSSQGSLSTSPIEGTHWTHR